MDAKLWGQGIPWADGHDGDVTRSWWMKAEPGKARSFWCTVAVHGECDQMLQLR